MNWRKIVIGSMCAVALVLTISKLAVAQETVYLPLLAAEQTSPDAARVSAAAGGNDKYKFQGETAQASIYSEDECGYSYVNLIASDNWYLDTPGGTKTSLLELWYEASDWCTYSFQYGYGLAELAKDDFTISSSLSSASANATFEVCDFYSGTCQPAEVSLTWAATGPRYQNRSQWSSGVPGCRTMSKYKATSRDASISGSILIGGVDYASGLDVYATLNNVTDGYMTIGCDAP
jgi:hypothetical protein